MCKSELYAMFKRDSTTLEFYFHHKDSNIIILKLTVVSPTTQACSSFRQNSYHIYEDRLDYITLVMKKEFLIPHQTPLKDV